MSKQTLIWLGVGTLAVGFYLYNKKSTAQTGPNYGGGDTGSPDNPDGTSYPGISGNWLA